MCTKKKAHEEESPVEPTNAFLARGSITINAGNWIASTLPHWKGCHWAWGDSASKLRPCLLWVETLNDMKSNGCRQSSPRNPKKHQKAMYVRMPIWHGFLLIGLCLSSNVAADSQRKLVHHFRSRKRRENRWKSPRPQVVFISPGKNKWRKNRQIKGPEDKCCEDLECKTNST